MDHNTLVSMADLMTCGMTSDQPGADASHATLVGYSGRRAIVRHPRMTGVRGADGALRISVRRAAPNPSAPSPGIGLQMGAQIMRAETD